MVKTLLWTTLLLGAPLACGGAPDSIGLVREIDWSRFKGTLGVKEGDTFGTSVVDALRQSLTYLEPWIAREYPIVEAKDGQEYYAPPFAKRIKESEAMGHEGAVRPLALFAWSKAAMIKTGVYPATGKELEAAVHDTELAIRGVALTHLQHKSGGYSWGALESSSHDWQSIYWASSCAGAAWMLWDRMHPSTKALVVKMMEYEANRFASPTTNLPADYWRNRNGKLKHAEGWGDSKAESNGWIARGLVVAQAMMPEHPNAARWREKASEFMVSSYTRPSDLENTTLVDGKPVKDWIDGYNTFEDGVLLNHDRAHPAYMTAHAFTYSTVVDASLAGHYIPQSSFFNEQVTWDAMTRLVFKTGEDKYGTGPNRPPGGTIYHKKADGTLDATPYFPNGNSWVENPQADVDYVLFDLYASVRGLDAGQEVKAIDWAAARVAALAHLQARPGHHGNFYQPGDWESAQDIIEVVTLQELTEAWVVWWLHSNGKISPVADHWGPVAGTAIASDGTLTVPGFKLPESSFLSVETRAALRNARVREKEEETAARETCPPLEKAALKDIPAIRKCQADAFYKTDTYKSVRARFDVRVTNDSIGGVPVEVFEPVAGVLERNAKRVLINLHGGGFLYGSRTVSHLESLPIAAIGGIKVISIDYRMGPEYQFPAASEDVAAVYRELLTKHSPQSIGIFGCSAGGVLTSESVAWLQKEGLPRPGAVGMLCAAGAFWEEGDSGAVFDAVYGYPPEKSHQNAYFKNADPSDPLVFPIRSNAVLVKFPPSLLISSVRDISLSSVAHMHSRLVALGVVADLHVWEGLQHAFHFDPAVPESFEAYDVTVKFFDRHLAVK